MHYDQWFTRLMWFDRTMYFFYDIYRWHGKNNSFFLQSQLDSWIKFENHDSTFGRLCSKFYSEFRENRGLISYVSSDECQNHTNGLLIFHFITFIFSNFSQSHSSWGSSLRYVFQQFSISQPKAPPLILHEGFFEFLLLDELLIIPPMLIKPQHMQNVFDRKK